MRRRPTGWLLVLSLLVAVPCWADDLEQAKAHFKKGDAHYANREYDQAIVEFKLAYQFSPIPLLLFNIAQAYRLSGDTEEALRHYREYVRLDPNGGSRKQADEKILELEKLLPKEPTPATPPPVALEPPGPSSVDRAPPATPESPRSGRGLEIAGLATAGAGVLMVGASIYFAMRASDGYDEITQLSEAGGMWSGEYASTLDRADRDKLTAAVLGAIGGVAIASGGVLYYLGWRQADRAEVAITPGGAMLTLGGRF